MTKFNKIQQTITLLGVSVFILAGMAVSMPAQAAWHQRTFGGRQYFGFSENRNIQQQSVSVAQANVQATSVSAQTAAAVVYINAYKDMPTYSIQYTTQGNRVYATRTQTGTSSQEVSSGSGFFITSDGYIMTNKHVVADTGATYRVSINGTSDVPATVVYRDPDQDLAVVKIDGSGYPTLSLADSSGLTVGQNVVAVGNALGKFTDYATSGNIVSLSNNIVVNTEDGGTETLNGVIESNAKLYPGDSGGPLLNSNGQVVAIDTATSTSRGSSQGYSIPINFAKTVLSQIGINI